jgi:hypothetical protein
MIERDIVTSVNIALYYTAFLQQSYYLKIWSFSFSSHEKMTLEHPTSWLKE